jgi:hypothetical protein
MSWLTKSHVIKTMMILWIEDRLSGMLQKKVIQGMLTVLFQDRGQSPVSEGQVALISLINILLRNVNDAPERRITITDAMIGTIYHLT